MMFTKLSHTNSCPAKPTLVWDGNCGFCKFWIIRWKRLSGDKIQFKPYQEAIHDFKDIDERFFKEAARLVDVDGKLYDGPAAAYKSLSIAGKFPYLLSWYEGSSFFRKLSDFGYQTIADNRNFAMKATKILVGDNPINLKSYWVFYLMILLGILLLFLGRME